MTMETGIIQRMLLERDLHVLRDEEVVLDDGSVITFAVNTLPNEAKQEIRRVWDQTFPVPPVVSLTMPNSVPVSQFDLEDKSFRAALTVWYQGLANSLFAATLGLSDDDYDKLEHLLPALELARLIAVCELVNGIQSEPLSDLLRDAIMAPEVTRWLETDAKRTDPDDISITDTPLYREIDAALSCGLNLAQWRALSARDRLTYTIFHDAKGLREAYINWSQAAKIKKDTNTNRHIK